jgi:hypothetical protein
MSSSQENAFGLIWNENKKLTWDDFQGEKNNFNSRYGAMTFSGLSLEYSWKYSETDDCNYEFDKILAIAVFEKKPSYVKPWVLEDNRQSLRILNHEQRHFDIAEIHARIFNQKAATEFLGEKFSCPSGTFGSYSQKSKIDALAKKQVRDIFNVIKMKLEKKQKSYDDDVEHSDNNEKQSQWNKKIDSQLKTLKEQAQKQKLLNQVQTSKDLKKQNYYKKPDFDFSQRDPKVIQINERNTITHMFSGEIPENIFTRGYPLELFVQSPDSSVAKHTIPVTAQKYYKYPVQFDSQSKIGEYKLVLQYKGQTIHSESIVVGSKDARNQFDNKNTFTIKTDCHTENGCVSSKRFTKGQTETFLFSGSPNGVHQPQIRIQYPGGHVELITVPSKTIDDKLYYEYPVEFNWESERGKYTVYGHDMLRHKGNNSITIEVGPLDKTPKLPVFKEKQYNVKLDDPKIVKSDCTSKQGIRVCDKPQYVSVKEGESTIFMMSGYISRYSDSLYKPFLRNSPIETVIEYPNSQIKKITTKVNYNYSYEIPLQFFTHSLEGKYKITMKHKDELLRSEVISVSLRENCEWSLGVCSVKKSLVETIALAENDKKITHLISGYVPETLYSNYVYVDFFIEFPDSSIKEYRIPVTSEKYFEYPLEFNQKSQQGEYKITVGYHGQKIDKTILNFVSNLE